MQSAFAYQKSNIYKNLHFNNHMVIGILCSMQFTDKKAY